MKQGVVFLEVAVRITEEASHGVSVIQSWIAENPGKRITGLASVTSNFGSLSDVLAINRTYTVGFMVTWIEDG